MEKNEKQALTLLTLKYLTKVRIALECTKNELTELKNKPLKEEKNKKHL